MTKREGLFITTSQLLGITGLTLLILFLPSQRWGSFPTSSALAADSQLTGSAHWDSVSEPCIEMIKSAENLYDPRGPLPEPDPLVIGCKLSDCGPGTGGPGPIDLRITLTGELADKANLEFENMTVREATRIVVRGNARHLEGTTRFKVRSGTTVLRGFRPNHHLRPPVTIPHLTLNQKALHTLKEAAKVDDLLANSKSSVTLEIEQFRGPVIVNRYAILGNFKFCRSLSLPTPNRSKASPNLTKLPTEPGPGKPHINPTKRLKRSITPPLELPQFDFVDFGTVAPPGDFMILAPGRMGTGILGCADYSDEVYKSSAETHVAISNHLHNLGVLKTLAHLTVNGVTPLTLQPGCHSEVVVYSESHALAVVQPVTPPWTDAPGDVVSVEAEIRTPLKMPVTVWILSADPSKTLQDRLVDNLRLATSIYNRLTPPQNNGMCGITFDEAFTINSVNSQLPVGHEDEYLRFDPAQGKTIMTAGCGTGGPEPCFYTEGSLNVYLVDYIGGDLGFTSYSPTHEDCNVELLPTCDNFGDMIFVVESRWDDTLTHEFGHTLELEGVTGIGGLTPQNIMWENGRGSATETFITKGQCYRANIDSFSYINTGGIRPSSSPTHGNCPKNGTPSEQCPDLSFVGP